MVDPSPKEMWALPSIEPPERLIVPPLPAWFTCWAGRLRSLTAGKGGHAERHVRPSRAGQRPGSGRERMGESNERRVAKRYALAVVAPQAGAVLGAATA